MHSSKEGMNCINAENGKDAIKLLKENSSIEVAYGYYDA